MYRTLIMSKHVPLVVAPSGLVKERKHCTKCSESKLLSEFYKSRSACKTCHNACRKQHPSYKTSRRATGFSKLDADVQDDIIKLMKTESIKLIADKHNIKYSTLTYWKRRGQIAKKSAQRA